MRLSPGYDFTVNEVPNREKFRLCLAGASLTGIAIAQIDAALIAQTFTSSTGLSLPAEGYINYDQNGFLWVRTRFGHCHLWRSNWGGWETLRYPAFAVLDTHTFPYGPGQPVGMLHQHTNGNTTESSVGYRAGTSIGRFIMSNFDTGVSGQHLRLLGRGCRNMAVPAAERVPANLKAGGYPDYALRNAASSADINATGFPAQSGGSEGTGRKRGLALFQISATGTLMWNFGMEAMQD